MRILHVIPWFHPARYFGGPIISVYELCNHLSRESNIELLVLTTDTAGPGRARRLNREDCPDAEYQGYRVIFCRKTIGTAIAPTVWLRIWRAVSWSDVVHITGVYSFTTFPALTAARVLRKPVIWSPRGALQRWAGSRRPGLKALWEGTCRYFLPVDRAVLHLTSAQELTESQKRIRNIPCVVIPNGVHVPALNIARAWIPRGKLRLLFLGRLDPKKGIENLLTAVAQLPTGFCSLRIVGEGDSAYVHSLRRVASELQIIDRVAFTGPLAGAQKEEAFTDSDICVVPSFTENFGMVVAEALAHGTPVIASTGTPWEEIESRKVGRWVPNDPLSLASAIRSMRKDDLPAMGLRGRDWMKAEFSWDRIGKRMLKVYQTMISASLGGDGKESGTAQISRL